MKIGDRARFTLALLLLLMTTGCAAKKVSQAMYCKQMEMVDDPRGVKYLQFTKDCHDGTCYGMEPLGCHEGAQLILGVNDQHKARCVVPGKHCAVWAKHPTECVHNVYGDCTADTK